jgi:hypothetical protein
LPEPVAARRARIHTAARAIDARGLPLREPSPDLHRAPFRPLEAAQVVAAVLGLAAMALYRVSGAVVDLDIWHEMAWFREALAHGRVPLRDPFAYTPTLFPSVHHEWAAGAIAYAIALAYGGAGLVALRYALLFGLGVLCWQVARARGAHAALFAPLAMVALLLVDSGFSTVRAQMYSFVLLAALLWLLERDRRGHRGWIPLWLALYVAWANLHGGFLVGAGLFFLHWFEQWWRGEPHRHLLATGIAMLPLALLTPYGVHYPAYLVHALTTDRSQIGEWSALLSAGSPAAIGAYAASLALLAYAVRCGGRSLRGLPLVLATAAYALTAQRMICLYGIVWICFVPGYLAPTPLGAHLSRLWTRRPLQLGFWSASLLVFTIAFWPAQPWRARVPGDWDPHLERGHVIYPVGAIDYLAARGFAGNLFVGFEWGAYATWKLHPNVRVSLDSRFEVAYPPDVVAEQYAFYRAEPGWAELLDSERYRATDAILVPRFFDSRIHERFAQLPNWKRVYRDRRFELFAREASDLPLFDRPDATVEGAFP